MPVMLCPWDTGSGSGSAGSPIPGTGPMFAAFFEFDNYCLSVVLLVLLSIGYPAQRKLRIVGHFLFLFLLKGYGGIMFMTVCVIDGITQRSVS